MLYLIYFTVILVLIRIKSNNKDNLYFYVINDGLRTIQFIT